MGLVGGGAVWTFLHASEWLSGHRDTLSSQCVAVSWPVHPAPCRIWTSPPRTDNHSQENAWPLPTPVGPGRELCQKASKMNFFQIKLKAHCREADGI